MFGLKEHVKGAALLIGALAGISYVLLRLVYVQFYAVFNLRPEDVGLGQSQLVSQALAGPVVVVLLAALIIALFVLAAATYGLIQEGVIRELSRLVGAAKADRSTAQVTRDVRRRCGEVGMSTRRLLRDHWQGILALSVLLGALVVVLALLVSARSAASRVRLGGQAVSNVSLDYAGFSIPLLNFQALRVDLHPRSAEGAALPALVDDCAFLLGAADGRLVVFDVRDEHTYLVPSDGLLIELRAEDLPPACLEGAEEVAAASAAGAAAPPAAPSSSAPPGQRSASSAPRERSS